MLYSVSWRGLPTVRDAAVQRFLATGGRPPEGVRMLGRWHHLGQISGFAIAEADDPSQIGKWAMEWSDVFEMDIRVVVTDEQAGPILAQIAKR